MYLFWIYLMYYIILQKVNDEKIPIKKRSLLLKSGTIWYNGVVGRKGLRRAPRNSVQKRGDCMSDFEIISINLMILTLVVALLKRDK